MPYTVIYSPYFKKKVKKITKKNQQLVKDIKSTLESLEVNPKHRSKRITEFKGKRRVHVRNSPYRIIYTICKECRELKEIKVNGCSKCEERDNLTVILRNFGHTKKIY